VRRQQVFVSGREAHVKEAGGCGVAVMGVMVKVLEAGGEVRAELLPAEAQEVRVGPHGRQEETTSGKTKKGTLSDLVHVAEEADDLGVENEATEKTLVADGGQLVQEPANKAEKRPKMEDTN